MGQQQWASQYASWTFDASTKDVWNVDQQVWVPEPNDTSFWPLQWSWQGTTGVGGYLGLQQEGASSQRVRFSLWKATAARGPNDNQPFEGEGVGYTCTMPVTIDTNKFYRLRLWRTEVDPDGQWWGAWLIETDNSGNLVEHLIGEIKVPAEYNLVEPSSITNFVEYWGQAVTQCSDVPLSVVGFTPPAVNYKGKGTGVYGGYSTYKDSVPAPDNHCQCGTEGNGALITATPYNFGFASGVMMFLGGASKTPKLNPVVHPTPPDMPDS